MDESAIRFDKGRFTPSIVSMFTANPAVNILRQSPEDGSKEDWPGHLNGRGVNARVQFSEIELKGLKYLKSFIPPDFPAPRRDKSIMEPKRECSAQYFRISNGP
jgi:hypothetical protein